jgi:hypothetical protein
MENVRHYRTIKLTADESKFQTLVASSRYKEYRVFHTNLYAVSLEPEAVYLNKPIYVGFTVLELSKNLMYGFHYGFMEEQFKGRCQLLFTDTDSLCYCIQSGDIYEELFPHRHTVFDFSEYPQGHPLQNDVLKKGLGYFKDEMKGRIKKIPATITTLPMCCFFRRSHL